MSHGNEYRQIVVDGLWSKNVIFVQMLALCPLIAVTSTATNGLGMGLATLAVLVVSNFVIASVRNIISSEVRIPVFVLLIATIVTLVDMGMNAWLHGLHKVLGLFIPLIVTNCAILGRAEAFASQRSVAASTLDGLMMGLGFTLALVILGAFREILGSGTLFADASLLLGNMFSFLQISFSGEYRGFLLMILPPGGFLALGLLLVGKRLLDQQAEKRAAARATAKNNAGHASDAKPAEQAA